MEHTNGWHKKMLAILLCRRLMCAIPICHFFFTSRFVFASIASKYICTAHRRWVLLLVVTNTQHRITRICLVSTDRRKYCRNIYKIIRFSAHLICSSSSSSFSFYFSFFFYIFSWLCHKAVCLFASVCFVFISFYLHCATAIQSDLQLLLGTTVALTGIFGEKKVIRLQADSIIAMSHWTLSCRMQYSWQCGQVIVRDRRQHHVNGFE